MENASKALIMAGSILVALLVIVALIFMYNQLTGAEQTKINTDEVSKMSDYSQKFEQYNKVIYGSELMSLSNLQEDYNTKQAEEKGYEPITITVTMKKSISGTNYFSAGTKNISSIFTDKNAIEEIIKQYEETKSASKVGKLYKNRVVKYYSQISYRQIADIYGIDYSSSEIDYDIGERLQTQGGEVSKLIKDIEEYKNIKSVYTEFKNKRFKCSQMEYGQTGRVNLMKFTEI